MRIFISGGCKNGKSYHAQHMARAQGSSPLYYIATMKPVCDEDNERIARHRMERDGWGFTTIEQPFNIAAILDKCDHNSSFLLDSLTALLANEMFLPDASVNEDAAEKIIMDLLLISDNIKNLVIVSDFIYGDAFVYDSINEKYRKSLAEIDRAAAEKCDVVLEIVYGNVIIHKGKKIFGGLYHNLP